MDFKNLIENIRKERVTLFLGSGFSFKAGGPRSSVLVDSLLSKMSSEERNSLTGKQLDYVAEEYEQVYGRDSLLEIIKAQMDFKRKDLSDHEFLTQIPHFHRIITTNYDTLIEDVYGKEKCYVVRNTKDCVNFPSDKTLIFKIHGDFSEKNNVIITKDDYTAFFVRRRNPLLWILIQAEVLTNDILFIGYSLEDSNIFEIMKTIKSETGGHTRNFYLIAPGLKKYKIERLAKTNVSYFDGVASDLFTELEGSLNKNIKRDFQKKWVSSSTFAQYCRIHNLVPVISEGENSNKVERFDAPKGKEVKVHFSTKDKNVYDAIINRTVSMYPDFIPNTKIPALKLSAKKLTEMYIEYNGLTVGYKDEMATLMIAPAFQKKLLSINIPSIGFFELVNSTLFKKEEGCVRCIIETNIYDIFIDTKTIDNDGKIVGYNINVTFEFKKEYTNNNEAIKWIDLPLALFSGEQVFVKELFANSPFKVSEKESIYQNMKEYYNDVKQIECLTGERFVKYECFTEERYNVSRYVLSYLKKEPLMEKTPDGSEWTFTTSDLECDYKELEDKGKVFVFSESTPILKPLILNGKEFVIPYRNIMRSHCIIRSIERKTDGTTTICAFNDEPQYFTKWSDHPIREEENRLIFD